MVESQAEGRLGSAEAEWIKKAQDLCSLLLSQAALVQAFRGRWMVICTRLQQLLASLAGISGSSSYNNHFKSILPQIVGTLEESKELVQRSIDLSYGGKLLMQSNLDALATKLDLHLHDLELLRCGFRADSIGAPLLETKKGVWELLGKLKIGNTEFKKGALDALIRYLTENEKAVLTIATEGSAGDLSRLVHLLDSCVQLLREKAATAVAILAREDGCKKLLMAEGVHAPLIRLSESGSSLAKEKATEALRTLTVISEMAHSVASHGGIPVLVKLCRHGTPAAMANAAGTLRNLAGNEQIRRCLAEEGAVDVLISLVTSGTPQAQEEATEALQNLASGRDDRIRLLIARQGGIQSLLLFLSHATSPKTQEIALRALGNLAVTATNAKALVSAGYVTQLVNVLRSGSSTVQQLAASAICNLSSSTDLKKHLGENGAIVPLTKMLEAKDPSEKSAAAQALSTFLLVNGSRRECFREEKSSIPRLVQLLDPRPQSIAKRFPMSALLALSGSSNHRKRIASTGSPRQHLDKLAEMNPTSTKKSSDKSGAKKLLGIFTRHRSQS